MDGDPWFSEACLERKKRFSLDRGRGGVPVNLAEVFFSPPSISSAKLARGRRWFFLDPGRVYPVWKNHLTKETPEAHVFKADLPGIKKEEVKVEVKDGRVLKISGERSREKEEKDETWHRRERSSGKFVRRFLLLEKAKPEEIKAQMEDGVLTVAILKVEVKKPDVKAIEISG